MLGDYLIYGTVALYFLAGVVYAMFDKAPYLSLLSVLYGLSNLIAYIFVRRS